MAEADIAQSHWRLEIASGPNQGAVVPLSGGCYRIGLDPSNDIVLADKELAAEQASIDITTSGVSITAHAAGTALRRRSLAPGATAQLRTGAEIRVGDTLLRLSGARARRRRSGVPAAILLVAAASAAGYQLAAPRAARSGLDMPDGSTASVISVKAAATALSGALRGAHLGGIALTGSDGALLASGNIDPAQQEDWTRVQQEFDARFGRAVALVDHVRLAAAGGMPDLALAAVSTDPIPVAIARDGSRLTEGAVLDGGWIIERITTTAVTLVRDGQTITMRL